MHIFVRLLTIVVCLLPAAARSASSPFYRSYSLSDEKGYNTVLRSIRPTSDGGFIGIGAAIASNDSFILAMKLDASGRVIWRKSFVAPGKTSEGWSISEVRSGYIALAVIGPENEAGTLVVMKLGPGGEPEWQRSYANGGEGSDAYSIEPTSDGGYLVSALDFSSKDLHDPVVGMKLDSTGGVVWQKDLENDRTTALHVTADGGAIVATNPFSQEPQPTTSHVLKLNATGSVEWDHEYAIRSGNLQFTSVRPAPGGYVVGGYTSAPGTADQQLVLRLDDLGNVAATYSFTSNSCPLADVEDATNGGYLLNFGYCVNSNAAARLDRAGAILWTQKVVTSVVLNENSIASTNDGGYVAAGAVGTVSSQIVVVKSDSDGNLPPCVQPGTIELKAVAAPAITVSEGATVTANASYVAQRAAVEMQPCDLALKPICEP